MLVASNQVFWVLEFESRTVMIDLYHDRNDDVRKGGSSNSRSRAVLWHGGGPVTCQGLVFGDANVLVESIVDKENRSIA